jgi:hypothetical protein
VGGAVRCAVMSRPPRGSLLARVVSPQNVDETLLYLNARNPEMEAVAAKYTQPPYNIKVMGNDKNYQIAQAMTWLIGNASNEHVLFLEKDFRLVESLDCTMEQLDNGVKMLESKTAHVVKYRSRHNPGRPNWARILYMGHEDDVFSRQPNLLCNFYHWVDSPEVRWPEKFYPCGENPTAVDGAADRSKVFYCSKAFYCNWSNNPFLIKKQWWHDEYVVNFDKFTVRRPVERAHPSQCAIRLHAGHRTRQRVLVLGFVWLLCAVCMGVVLVPSTLQSINPYEDLELYMNWEPNAWNDRPFVVAQGEGMFRHVDKKKWG